MYCPIRPDPAVPVRWKTTRAEAAAPRRSSRSNPPTFAKKLPLALAILYRI